MNGGRRTNTITELCLPLSEGVKSTTVEIKCTCGCFRVSRQKEKVGKLISAAIDNVTLSRSNSIKIFDSACLFSSGTFDTGTVEIVFFARFIEIG